jgi:uncharacterized Rmd1/YagE family protein
MNPDSSKNSQLENEIALEQIKLEQMKLELELTKTKQETNTPTNEPPKPNNAESNPKAEEKDPYISRLIFWCAAFLPYGLYLIWRWQPHEEKNLIVDIFFKTILTIGGILWATFFWVLTWFLVIEPTMLWLRS